MKEKPRQEAVDVILLSMATYYQHQLYDSVIDIYHALWAEHKPEDIDAACRIWMKKNSWFPKANEIIHIIEHQKGPDLSKMKKIEIPESEVPLEEIQAFRNKLKAKVTRTMRNLSSKEPGETV